MTRARRTAPATSAEQTSSPALPAPERRRTQVRFGHLWVDAIGFADALREIERIVDAREGGSVFTPNVDHVVIAEEDAELRAAYAQASLSLADGQPLIWGARLLGTPLPEKVSGSDLVWPLMELAARRGWRVYLLGGAPRAADTAGARFARELGVCVVGVDPSRIELGVPSADAAAERVRAASPDVVLVALGSPKQERWVLRAAARIRPAVAVAVGAALDFVAGHVRRAPPWISRAGLEWLFRLAQEPRRLAHRYLVRDPRFLAVLAHTARAPRAERAREV